MIFKSPFENVEPDSRFGGLVSNFFWTKLDEFSKRTLFIDFASGRQWTGGQVKQRSAIVARNLISRCKLAPNSDCVSFYYHSDHLQLAALGLLFAGASLCAGAPEDPEHEQSYMLELMSPALVLCERALVKRLLGIRANSNNRHTYNLVVMDDDDQAAEECESLRQWASQSGVQLFGYHRDLCTESEQLQTISLPVQVSPERPAFVLLTSGSTGRPKPVSRSQRNSLYVCQSLQGAAGTRLWHMEAEQQTVLAGHLQLDHGTGTFCFKQTIAKGLPLVIMHGYQYSSMVAAIREHRITDICLGSGLLHNFISQALDETSNELQSEHDLESVRNFLAVGSPIASQELVDRFEARYKQCSVRTAYGMTECGFLAISERLDRQEALVQRAKIERLAGKPVGYLLPNVEAKLVDNSSGQEISQFGEMGELLIRAPTVSPGYLGGEELRSQWHASFQADGFYKSNDLCQLLEGGLLLVRGRYSEILCLHDGWKVLPSEIEYVLQAHPLVAEAVVFGVPHPVLPTCHAPRAYVVPKAGVEADFDLDFEQRLQEATHGALLSNGHGKQTKSCATASGTEEANGTKPRLTGQVVYEYAASMMSEPKHLTGGVRIVRQLPRISIGKFDKKLLRKLDGFL